MNECRASITRHTGQVVQQHRDAPLRVDMGAIQQSKFAPTVRRTAMRAFTGDQCSAWLVALMLSTPALALGQTPCPGIHVKILNIRNSTGTVACALFESPVGFPTDYLRSATNVMVIKIRKDQARCDFEDIPPGDYAMAVVHDET